jgi:hypothetical protein
MYDFRFWEYGTEDADGFPTFQQTQQLPSSGLTSLQGFISPYIGLRVGGVAGGAVIGQNEEQVLSIRGWPPCCSF